ncbi:hypothetical protein GCM10010524_60320 [Streptomyces mexicanus]
MKVFAWTIDDASRARTAAGYGVDGIISDAPDTVGTALNAA